MQIESFLKRFKEGVGGVRAEKDVVLFRGYDDCVVVGANPLKIKCKKTRIYPHLLSCP